MPVICWTWYFLEAQGYKVTDNILFQDNRSTMLLAKNGKVSSTKHTKHINIWYFFITDQIAKGDLTVEWCLTGEMVGDYMTKPLQGVLFHKFCDQIMGTVSIQDPCTITPKKQVNKILAPQIKKVQRHRSVLEEPRKPEKLKWVSKKISQCK
jgi:hypothetical protein